MLVVAADWPVASAQERNALTYAASGLARQAGGVRGAEAPRLLRSLRLLRRLGRSVMGSGGYRYQRLRVRHDFAVRSQEVRFAVCLVVFACDAR